MKKYIIVILLVILIVTVGISRVQQNQTETQNKNKVQNKLQSVTKENVTMCATIPKPEELDNYITMQATGYDLSIQCCGKSYNNPSRGMTRDGSNLNNKYHSEVWTVASNKFPLGTKLQLEFPESHKKYNGVYTVRDTGNFNENVLDVYIGDYGEKVHRDTINFGRVDVKVFILDNTKNTI